jgi:hypothetical protein
MLVIENTILSSMLKFTGFNSMYILDSDEELDELLGRLKCAMVVSNPAVNAHGFIQHFLSALHTSTTDLLYRHGFSKENFLEMPGISRYANNSKAVDVAYTEYITAMAEYSRLLLPKDDVNASFNLRNQTIDIKLLSNSSVRLVIPTIIKTNKLTGKKSFSILDTSVSKVSDVFEYSNYAYASKQSITNITNKLFGSGYKVSSGDMVFRVIRTINSKFSSYLGFSGMSSTTREFLKSTGIDPDLTLAYYKGLDSVVIKNGNNSRHTCATVSSLNKVISSSPFDSLILLNTKVYSSMDRTFSKESNFSEATEYINADEVVFYCQVDKGDSIEYDVIKPCDNCPNFMGRISTTPRCTFMSHWCNNVEYTHKGKTSWASIKYKHRKEDR